MIFCQVKEAKLQDTRSYCGSICTAYIWNGMKTSGRDDLGGDKVQERLTFHDLAPFNIYIVPGVCITTFFLF